MMIFGLLALLALVGSALVGYGVFGPPSDLQPAHSLAAFAAVLLAVFANGWVVLFLWGSGRALRRLSGDGAADAGSRWAIAAGILAMLAFGGTFWLGHLALSRHDPVTPHHVLFFVAGILQIATLVLGWRALAASDRLAAALEARSTPTVPAGAPDAA